MLIIILKLHPIVYEYEFGRSDQPDFLEEFIDQCTNDEKVSVNLYTNFMTIVLSLVMFNVQV